MYKALKSAQNEIQEALLKFVDEAAQGQNAACACSSATTRVVSCAASRGNPCQCALITQSVPVAPLVRSSVAMPSAASVAMPSSCNCAALCTPRLEQVERTLQYLIDKQEAQYEILVGGIQDLNVSLKLLIQQVNTVETATTIPNLAPQSQGSDLKNVSVAMAAPEPTSVAIPTSLAMPESEEAEAEVDAEGAEEVDVDVDEQVDGEVEVEVEVEEEDTEDADAEPDIEVEEWTYKGRLFFKDSENTVYANNAGEIGDPIGQYDPSKNIVKKLPTN